jgi:NAD(P)-dependent dehydrogenase (short-subunit alcohol dehydrogenase family)
MPGVMASDATPGVVLITGASRGIGREAALGLARRGWSVGLLARDTARLQEVAEAARGLGGKSVVVQGDVAAMGTAERAMDEVERALGPLDAVVNNAAVVAPLGWIWEVDPRQLADHVAINTTSLFLFTRAALGRMVPRGKGLVVNVSSGAARSVNERRAVYAATKASVDSFTRSVAAEAAHFGVRVCAVYPGIVDTDMQREMRDAPVEVMGPELKAEIQRRYDERIVRQPEQLGEALARVVADPGIQWEDPVFRLEPYIPK